MSDSYREKLTEEFFLKLLEKTVRGGIREDEAQFLLRAFGQRTSATVLQRMNRIEERIVEDGSLKDAALYYQKDPRTIRRWCEKGLFLSAFRTQGNHWRIPFNSISEAETRMRKQDRRKPKTVFGTSEWQNFRALMKRVFRGIGTAREIEAALRDLGSMEFRKENCPISDRSIELLKAALEKGTVAALRLRAAAQRLRAENPSKSITVRALAAELNISRASLYRARYGAKKAVRAAIRAVEREGEPPKRSNAAAV